jgi:hypothetical protein
VKQNADDRILTRHPAGKQGVRIARDRYDAMREAILEQVPRRKLGVAWKDLPGLVRPLLPRAVYGPGVSVTWYCVVVKLDLEARGQLVRVPGAGPQRLRRP